MQAHRRFAVLLAVTAIVVGACSTGSDASVAPSAPPAATAAPPTAVPSEAAAPVTIDWWHVQNNDPGKSLWQKLADEYTAANPNVTINVRPLENETSFKPQLATALQAQTPPDLFQSWGGGGMKEQVDAGLIQDITAEVAPWKDALSPGALSMYALDGKQYGIPFDLGLVGFWYNKDQFATAGITTPPATWDEFLADVQKLKDAKLVPIALAGGETWTGAFYWAYLALRAAGAEGVQNAIKTGDWSSPAFVQAGEEFKKLVDLEPFQEGFQAAGWDGAGTAAASMATGTGAIQLMGQWLPGTIEANSPGQKTQINLGWFPFPAVTGAPGDPADGLGGGNGFVVGKDAPVAAAADLLRSLTTLDAAKQWAATPGILPVTIGAGDAVTDPNAQAIVAAIAKSKYVQLYLDQATSPAFGNAINAAVAKIYNGTASPADVAAEIAAAAKQ